MNVCNGSKYSLLIVLIAVSIIVDLGDYRANHTAGGPMVRTAIILVRRPISLDLIKDLSNHTITVPKPLKWRKSRKERWICWDSNPGFGFSFTFQSTWHGKPKALGVLCMSFYSR